LVNGNRLLVYAGFSFGAGTAQRLAQTKRAVKGSPWFRRSAAPPGKEAA
jgi:hypothetical protein